ncbi:MAG: hypothetical protein IKE55_07330 [Kiritimatiellae bacterium]|nr:hypothetical protein [Kiritimatiellia bacterium]
MKWRKLLKGGFSTFLLFNFSTVAFVVATANAAEPADTQLTLGEVELPVYMSAYNQAFTQPIVAYPISTVRAPTEPGEKVTVVSSKDAAMKWELAAWTIGRTLSEQPPDAKLGDFCTDIPFAPDEIDWAATVAANATAIANGQIVFNTGAASAYERVIFTASGATEMTWVRTGGETTALTYAVGSSSSARPYRIFATRVDEANSAAFIDLTGKFVKFFGDPKLLRSEYKETTPGVSNVVYGIDYDPSKTKMLTVRYRVNEETGAIDCPQGQFVLAYYDTETKDHMVAHVVVEICPPNVTTLHAEVGDCLKPAGGGYGAERLYAAVAAGLSTENNDPYSPYLEQYTAAQGEEMTDPDHGKLFAVAPTDVSTSSSGMAMPWKVDVFWQTEDPMKTKWNFEHDWYLVSWPENPLRVVVPPSGMPAGCPIVVPTNYVATTGFKLPADVSATYNAHKGELTLNGAHGGQVLVKVSNESGGGCPSYLPVELTDYRDAAVATPTVFEWPVGVELTPRIGLEAGPKARAMSERVDDNLPGFIYEPESLGRNWNPRLYHRPGGSTVLSSDIPTFDDLQAEQSSEDQEDDPFASLQSAIYGVNGVDNAKIQVWWRANFQTERMSVPVSYPALVQNYRVTWDATLADGLLPTIVLASQLGSADPKMTACGGRSLLLVEKNSTASVNLGGRGIPSGVESTVLGFSCYASPDGDATPGRLATWRFGGRGAEREIVVEASLEADGADGFRVAIATNGAAAASQNIKPGVWTAVRFEVAEDVTGRNVTATYGASDAAAGDSATFVALDDLALWFGDAASPTEDTAIYSFDFTAADLSTRASDGTVRTATDSAGNVLTCRNCAVAGAGASGPFALALKAEDGVSPEIYYENDWSQVGYNPNEEHAFVDAGDDGYVVWALRDDLNTAATSKPLVMVMYAENGKGRMQAYTITRTSEIYKMASTALVGNPLLPPAPVGRLAGCQTEIDATTAYFGFDDNSVGYKDRKNGIWARRDGITSAKYGYPMQTGFYFPSLTEQPAVGTPIAWLACKDMASPSLDDVTNITAAVCWEWTVNWPTNVPELKIGQVLTKATQGLPEMWNAASMAVCYPNPSLADVLSGVASPATVAKLIDPTVKQSSTNTLPVKASFPDEYGFVLGPSGTTFLRKGKYYFNGLPPSISDRFYVTVEDGGVLNPGLHATMNLVGQLVEKEAGGSYLELNVLTDAERDAIKALCVLDPVQKAAEVAAWNAAADSLAVKEVDPSPRTNFGAPVTSTGRKEITLAFPNEYAYTNWMAKIANDTSPLAANRFKVSEFEFSKLSTPLTVLAGKPATNEIPGAAFATWHETERKVLWVGSERLEYAKKRFTETGMDKYLGKAWDEIDYPNLELIKLLMLFPPNVCFVKGYFTWESKEYPAANTYLPRDHYALVADGTGVGYVTLIENDNPDTTQVSEGLPIQMHVVKVVPELYADGIAVLNDPLNKLSEKLTLLYRTPLGSESQKFEFQWCYATPDANGSVPEKGSPFWKDRALATGLVSLQLGMNSANLQDYVNTYYTLRYRPVKGSQTWDLLAAAHPEWTSDDDFWSPWADEQLAEGWLQRVLNSLTPFAQRVEDFYNNPSDIAFTMLEQIGRPYQGDVALNNDNLSEVGLLELYQTVFNRAESLLIASGGNNIDMSKQLLLVQTRMGEFYSLLGAEAYSDAKNPLISAGADGQQFPSGTFSFANQVPSLLDEELALLRGRTSATAFPRMTEAPLYNRLAWNLTKGITEGEPAYVANYGIRARDGILDVNCAAAQYPQGHGDAWGHYLSALTGYYRLLRNPYFDWTAAMGEMLMDQKLMNVDYQDEQKFADAAVKLVQTGTDAMDLTLRKAYKENGGDATAAYFDADEEQAFGYGEWATRTGMAAAYSWMTVNALLPTNDAPYQAFTDKGISKINRVTASELPVLASSVRVIENKLNGFEAGANPLGLSENAIPFDIDPDRLAQKDSHFEQILERAEKSLANCRTVLGYASEYGSRLAQISKEEESVIKEVEEQELAFNNQLIAIYGTPYSGDIGAGGTYPQGYDGPDIYNYTYMDLTPYGIIDSLQTTFTNSYKIVERDTGHYVGLGWKYKNERDWLGNEKPGYYEEIPIYYVVNDGGIRMKPLTITGSRRAEGSIQAAYRNYLKAYLKVKEVMTNYDTKLTILKEGVNLAHSMEKSLWQTVAVEFGVVASTFKTDTMENDHEIELGTLGIEILKLQSSFTENSIPSVQGAGMTVIVDPRSTASAAQTALKMSGLMKIAGYMSAQYNLRYYKKIAAAVIQGVKGIYDLEEKIRSTYDEMRGKIDEAAMAVNLALLEIQPAFADLSAAEAAYRAEVEKGEQLLEQRALWRQQVANNATEQRYLDMYNRVQRNIALTKYTTAFDSAQRYVWELAKVYDYETGLLSTDPQAGKQFLADIIATRSLGQPGVSISSATTDGGLYDIVNRMKANWDVLKPRLGINNPDKPAKWFSLRREFFRIKEGADGDAAWRKELAKYRVDNILTDPDFLRHCQPPASQNAVVVREPGYIIPFSTAINNAENFFGRPLIFGDGQFSSADYATKIDAVGVDLVGLDQLAGGAGVEPNIYLVPVGLDYMRSPAGTTRALLSWNVVDQVMPLPYTVGSAELDAQDWISTFSGLDGTSDATATIRRHSTLRAGADFKSTRLVGRSVWNDRWLVVIPASAIDADREKAMKLIEAGVKDIKLGIKAYSRQGN